MISRGKRPVFTFKEGSPPLARRQGQKR